MRFDNPTQLDAQLFRGEVRADEILATAVVKTRHDIGADGRLSAPLLGTAMPSATDTATELGVIPTDLVPYRRGVDVWVLGHARPPRATAAMTIELSLGRETRALLVVGDRRWRRDGTASAPVPFDEMPVCYSRAYGGRVVADDDEQVHPLNPDGRGFVTSARALDGALLPNIEWPDDRVRSWSCRPRVAGFSALAASSPMQVVRAIRPDADAPLGFRLTRASFSCANEQLVFARADPGTSVRLAGMGPGGALAFELPSLSLVAVVVLGTRRHALPLALDTIGILADLGQVVFSYRASFRYGLVKHQRRIVTLQRTAEVQQ